MVAFLDNLTHTLSGFEISNDEVFCKDSAEEC